MKIRKVFLFSSAIILSLCLITFIGINVYASLKENENTKIVEKIKDVIPNDIYLVDNELSLPTLQLNNELLHILVHNFQLLGKLLLRNSKYHLRTTLVH